MRLKSLHLHSIHNLPDIDLDFTDAVTSEVRPRTVIAGSNGSGKTTILETIFALLSHAGNPSFVMPQGLALGKAKIEMNDFPVLPHKRSFVSIGFVGQAYAISWGEGSIAYATNGISYNQEFPNCVYLPSEGRELNIKEGAGSLVNEPVEYSWTYRFERKEGGADSLESFLVAMDYRDLIALREGKPGDEFPRFMKRVNSFLQGKRIAGVDKNFRIKVESEKGQEFGIAGLSSGEKQILLLLGEIQLRLRRGGLLLIDEPEIHLHPRWQRLLVRALTDLCAEYDAQMILTTHSREIAGAVYEHELVLLDEIFAEDQENEPASDLL